MDLGLGEIAAIIGIATTASGAVGFVLKAAHDRNIDAHDGIVGKVTNHANSAQTQVITMARIESALESMNGKLDRFEREYWRDRADHKSENV
jgi:hypothetical protein